MKLALFLVLFSGTLTAQIRQQDTIVRKRYLDSLKNQLAIYTLSSYTYLNLYDKSEFEKSQLKVTLEKTENTLNYILWRRRKENRQMMYFFIGLGVFTIGVLASFK